MPLADLVVQEALAPLMSVVSTITVVSCRGLQHILQVLIGVVTVVLAPIKSRGLAKVQRACLLALAQEAKRHQDSVDVAVRVAGHSPSRNLDYNARRAEE